MGHGKSRWRPPTAQAAWLTQPASGAGSCSAAAAWAVAQLQTMMPPAPALPYDFSTPSPWGGACGGEGYQDKLVSAAVG